MPEQATEEGNAGAASAPYHAELALGAASTSASRPRTETAPENVLQELFSGIWLAEDDGGAAEARNGPAQSPSGPHGWTAAPAGQHSVLNQLAALPDGADVPSGVADGIDDGKYWSGQGIV